MHLNSFKADLQAKKEVRLWKLDEAISYDNARKALLNAVKGAKIKIKVQNGPFGLHSFHVGAPTAAANTGQVGTARLRRQLKELEELMKQKKQKKFAKKKE